MKLATVITICVMVVTLHAFPLRGAEQGSVLNLGKFTYENGYKADKDKSALKLLFVYNSEKRLSKKQYKAFDELCGDIKITCMALDKAEAESAAGRIVTVKDPHKYLKELRIIALPTTLVLDRENRIVHATGYEGNYIPKMKELLQELDSKSRSF